MKQYVSLSILVLFLAFSIFLAGTVSAKTIPVFGCMKLNQSNAAYEQATNITFFGSAGAACLNITAANVTFSGNGFSITHGLFQGTAIYSSQAGTVLQDLDLRFNYASPTVHLEHSSFAVIENSLIYGGSHAVLLRNMDTSIIRNVVLSSYNSDSNKTGTVISVEDSDHLLLTNLSVSGYMAFSDILEEDESLHLTGISLKNVDESSFRDIEIKNMILEQNYNPNNASVFLTGFTSDSLSSRNNYSTIKVQNNGIGSDGGTPGFFQGITLADQHSTAEYLISSFNRIESDYQVHPRELTGLSLRGSNFTAAHITIHDNAVSNASVESSSLRAMSIGVGANTMSLSHISIMNNPGYVLETAGTFNFHINDLTAVNNTKGITTYGAQIHFEDVSIDGSTETPAFSTITLSHSTLKNFTVSNTNPAFSDFRATGLLNDTSFIDVRFANYTILQRSLITVRDTGQAEIKFLRGVNGTGTNFTADIQVNPNFVFVNDTLQSGSLNQSANVTLYNLRDNFVTLYNLRGNFTKPFIMHNGHECDPSACVPSTSLNAQTVSFTISSPGAYRISSSGNRRN